MQSDMKIALLSEKYTPDIGGLAISAERLARLLASAGHQVRVFAPTLQPVRLRKADSPLERGQRYTLSAHTNAWTIHWSIGLN